MNKSKSQRYDDLIAKFTTYEFTNAGLSNPHSYKGFDYKVINPWELWHNNLNADVMLIGQDFCDSASLTTNLESNWAKEKRSPTNKKSLICLKIFHIELALLSVYAWFGFLISMKR